MFDRSTCFSYNGLITMKVFITGGTGFIGSHLVELLLSKNAEIFALVRDPDRLKFLQGQDVQLLKGDLFEIPPLPSGLDCVYHLAGLTKALKSADYYTVNQRGTASLFETLARRHLSPKVVYLSSLAAGGPSTGSRGRKETDPPAPLSPYGKSKLLGEKEALARKSLFPVTIIRVGAVYGPRDVDFLNYFNFLKRGLMPIVGFKKRPITLCYVKDLARALVLASGTNLDSGEIVNIGDPIPRTMEDVGRAAGRALGKRPIRFIAPYALTYTGAIMNEFASLLLRRPSIMNRDKAREYIQPGWVADVDKASQKLSFVTHVSLEEGMRETIRWYEDHGWL